MAGIILQSSNQGEKSYHFPIPDFLRVEVNDIPQTKEVEISIACEALPPPSLSRILGYSYKVRFVIQPSSSVQRFLQFNPQY